MICWKELYARSNLILLVASEARRRHNSVQFCSSHNMSGRNLITIFCAIHIVSTICNIVQLLWLSGVISSLESEWKREICVCIHMWNQAAAQCVFFFQKSFPRPHCALLRMYGDNLFTIQTQVSSENASLFNIHNRFCRFVFHFTRERFSPSRRQTSEVFHRNLWKWICWSANSSLVSRWKISFSLIKHFRNCDVKKVFEQIDLCAIYYLYSKLFSFFCFLLPIAKSRNPYKWISSRWSKCTHAKSTSNTICSFSITIRSRVLINFPISNLLLWR